jgi:hypothetical protein
MVAAALCRRRGGDAARGLALRGLKIMAQQGIEHDFSIILHQGTPLQQNFRAIWEKS